MDPRSDVIAVDPALLKRFMLDDLYGRMQRPLPPGDRDRHAAAPGDFEAQVVRAGYLTGVVETETFEAARKPIPWRHDLLRAGGDVALELALAEPEGKPAPADPAARTR